jgi:hypothetical protein
MLVRLAILAVVCLVILGGVWAVPGLRDQGKNQDQDQPSGKPVADAKPGEGAQDKPAAQAAPAGNPDEPRPILLSEAVALVEKTGKGEAVRAEKVGSATSAQFNIDVVGKDGARTQFNVNATGKVVLETPQQSRPTTGQTKGRERERREKDRPKEQRSKEKEREREDK